MRMANAKDVSPVLTFRLLAQAASLDSPDLLVPFALEELSQTATIPFLAFQNVVKVSLVFVMTKLVFAPALYPLRAIHHVQGFVLAHFEKERRRKQKEDLVVLK